MTLTAAAIPGASPRDGGGRGGVSVELAGGGGSPSPGKWCPLLPNTPPTTAAITTATTANAIQTNHRAPSLHRFWGANSVRGGFAAASSASGLTALSTWGRGPLLSSLTST